MITAERAERRFTMRWGRLNRQSLRTLVFVGLAAQIAFTAAGAAVIYHTIVVTGQTSEAVARTSEIRVAANAMIRAITEAQSGERGFVLSGNERFLESYTASVGTVPQAALHLRELLGDNPQQIGRIRELEALFAQWRDQVARQEIAARQAAPSGYAAETRAAVAPAGRLRQTVASYAATGGADVLRICREEAAGLKDQLSEVLRMAPPSLVSRDWPGALSRLDTIAGTRNGAPAAPLLEDAAAVESMVRRHALSAEAADAKVMTFITRHTAQASVDKIRRLYDVFAAAEDARLDDQVAQGRSATRLAEGAAVAIPIALVGLLLVGVVHATGATQAIDRIIDASRGLAAGDLTRRVRVTRGDEIGALGGAFNHMAEQIAFRNRQGALLREMSEMLEASMSADEALTVMSRYAQEMLPATLGGVYLMNPSRDALEIATSWGTDPLHPLVPVFAPDECWALRRGQVHVADAGRGGVMCRHVPPPAPAACLCLPLTAQGETLGIMHVTTPARPSNGAGRVELPAVAGQANGAAAPPGLSESAVSWARTAADRAGLAIANLKLRDSLRAQSIRDPLTGVYNRRYLEETLEREVRRAERTHQPLGIIMFDIDGFKQFNDTFGHDAGDAFLRELGVLLRDRFRREDVVCRYGGEEFVVVLPEASLESTMQRAQSLGEAVGSLAVTHHGQPLGAATLSLGVAALPQHGPSGAAVLRAADTALYRAKQNGRARAEAAAVAG